MKEIIIAYDENTESSPVIGDWVGELVRCRDCKHKSDKMYDYYGNPNDKVYVCQINDLAKKPDWFCADGERKK